MVQHDYNEAEIEKQEHRQDSPEPLTRVEDINRIWPQVRPSAKN